MDYDNILRSFFEVAFGSITRKKLTKVHSHLSFLYVLAKLKNHYGD